MEKTTPKWKSLPSQFLDHEANQLIADPGRYGGIRRGSLKKYFMRKHDAFPYNFIYKFLGGKNICCVRPSCKFPEVSPHTTTHFIYLHSCIGKHIRRLYPVRGIIPLISHVRRHHANCVHLSVGSIKTLSMLTEPVQLSTKGQALKPRSKAVWFMECLLQLSSHFINGKKRIFPSINGRLIFTVKSRYQEILACQVIGWRLSGAAGRFLCKGKPWNWVAT